MTEKEVTIGSIGLHPSSHALLSRICMMDVDKTNDTPFDSITEAFRFAFSLGYSRSKRIKMEGSKKTVNPRQFVVKDYQVLLSDILNKEQISLGQLINEFAEAGVAIIQETISSGNSILSLIDS